MCSILEVLEELKITTDASLTNKALEWFGRLYIWCHSSASEACIATSMLLYHGLASIAFLTSLLLHKSEHSGSLPPSSNPYFKKKEAVTVEGLWDGSYRSTDEIA